MGYKFFILIFVILLISNFTLANIQLGNLSHKIDSTYTTSKPITGWVNFSLDNEPGDTLISGFGSNITIKKFLDGNNIACNVIGPYECSCFPNDCEPSYTTTGSPSTEKTYSMGFVSTQVFGIKLTGNISKITDFRFNISTNAKDSCLIPLMIDLFDDDNIDFRVLNVSDDECAIENPFGCYKSEDLEGNTSIGTVPLCNKITLPPLRGFRIGANIIGTVDATLSLTLDAGGIGDSCTKIVSSGGEISCKLVLDQALEDYTEAEVCIFSDEGSKNKYSINFEDVDSCGFVGDINGPKHDFEIFVKPLKYSPPSKITFDQNLFDDEFYVLNTNIFDYLNKKYNAECDPECIIPIRIYSGVNQDLTISELFIDYEVEELNPAGSDESNFYNLNSVETLMSSEFLKLDLLEMFMTPSTTGELDFVLNIGSETIIQNISVIDIPEIKNIIPNKAAFSVPTTFIVILDRPSGNLTYTWDFGDNTPPETTTTNRLSHTYSALGSYQIKVIISNNLGMTSKTTTINVIAPYDAINETIIEYRTRLKNLDNSLFILPDWIQKRILKIVDINDLKSAVNKLESDYKELFITDDEDLVKIMTSLNNLNIPIKLEPSLEIRSMKFIQNKDRLDVSILEEFGAGNLDEEREDEYYPAINRWLDDNLDITLESKTYSFYYDDQREQTILSHVTLRLNPRTDIEEFYMIIEGDTNNIKFFGDYSEREIDTLRYGIRFLDLISGEERKIEFSYPETIEVFNPPLYVSPEFRKIELGFDPGICNNNNICEENLGEDFKNCRVDCKPIKLTVLFLAILFFITFVVYIALQEWYKRNYESHLFKNKNHLFNLLTFMNNAVIQKIPKGQIFNKLKPFGWSNEQLKYGWKKLHGKRTGMWEIPIFLPFEKRKIKKEIEKRKSIAIRPNVNPVRRY